MKKLQRSRKLRIESLEGRTLLAVTAGGLETAAVSAAPTESVSWVVNTAEDPLSWSTTDSVLSLREAISRAEDGDTVTFAAGISGQTITLSGSELSVAKSITIDASSVGGMVVDAAYESRVFRVTGGSFKSPVNMVGLIISRGSEEYGAGINNDGILTMTDCAVTGCLAAAGNLGNSAGGGIYNGNILTMTNCSVTDNSVQRGSEPWGGGIANANGILTMIQCSVTDNYSSNEGGGIFNDAELSMENCIVADNTGEDNGGGIDNFGTLSITNCAVVRNVSLGRVGGIDNSNILTMTNCTVAGNHSEYGEVGGLWHGSGTSLIYNSIIVQNTAGDSVSDVYYDTNDDNAGTISAYNTLSSFTGWTESDYCLTYDLSRPLFTDAASGDYTLAKNSQAIDKGNNGYIAGYTTDLAGEPRIVNGIVDLGTYEYQTVPETPSTVVTTNLDVADSTDGLISLREAIDYANPGDTVTFAAELSGKTIMLGWRELSIAKSITIDASSVGGVTVDAGYGSRVFSVTGGSSGSPVKMVGLTISRGSEEYGAGINNDGVLEMTGCTVTGCLAETSGVGNSAGGGIYNSSILTMTDCLVTNNSVKRGIEPEGGGIANASGILTMIRCSVTDNFSSNEGGGIFNNAELVMKNCTVADNIAGDDGGGIVSFGTLSMTNCAVVGNISQAVNGGICSGGELTMINCTVAGNSANYGEDGSGGLENSGASRIYNSIIVQNIAAGSSNDVHNYEGGVGDPGTIFAHNTLSSFTEWTEQGYCLIYDPSEPLFAAGSYALAENSQAINKGSNGYIAGYTTDLAGEPRIVGGTVDLGAYEYQGADKPLTAPTILTGNKGFYVSYGANRHYLQWSKVDNASGYELAYSTDGNTWASIETAETGAVVRGLTYGADMVYRVRALGTGSYANSDWSEVKTFNVCPMDINNDLDVSGGDRTLLVFSWLAGEGEDNYRYYADINGDGDVGGADRAYLSVNWLLNVEEDADDLQYPPAKRADAVFAEYVSEDVSVVLDVF